MVFTRLCTLPLCPAQRLCGSCCDCREIVWKMMEQVKAESEQWTEMQDMLEQVRLEMQELQYSRDTWQHRAMGCDISLHSLNSQESKLELHSALVKMVIGGSFVYYYFRHSSTAFIEPLLIHFVRKILGKEPTIEFESFTSMDYVNICLFFPVGV